jgi:hypothetical protein
MNGMKSQASEAASTPSGPQVTGKYLIIGVFAVALTAAAMSWWIRYDTTHRAAEFWGAEASTLIRDAPHVSLVVNPQKSDKKIIDVSHARGLLHLRSALLEDHSFVWTEAEKSKPHLNDDLSHWWLIFSDPTSQRIVFIGFSEDCGQAIRITPNAHGMQEGTTLSTEPIAAGVREMFAEFSAMPATNAGEPSR